MRYQTFLFICEPTQYDYNYYYEVNIIYLTYERKYRNMKSMTKSNE